MLVVTMMIGTSEGLDRDVNGYKDSRERVLLKLMFGMKERKKDRDRSGKPSEKPGKSACG